MSICNYIINWKRGPSRCCYVVTLPTPPPLQLTVKVIAHFLIAHFVGGGEGFLRRSKRRRRHLPKIKILKKNRTIFFRQTDIVVHWEVTLPKSLHCIDLLNHQIDISSSLIRYLLSLCFWPFIFPRRPLNSLSIFFFNYMFLTDLRWYFPTLILITPRRNSIPLEEFHFSLNTNKPKKKIVLLFSE